jgi:hypothetical protein
MKIPTLPFTVTDWSGVPPTVHLGETGQATWRTFTIGDLRVRLVEYSAGYTADHWCDLGHVLYVCASASKGDPTPSAYQGLDFPMRIPGFGGVPIGADGDPTMLLVFVNLSEC